MRLLNTPSKIFLYFSVLTGSLWTGVYLLRMLLTYQVFEGTDLTLRAFITEGNLQGIYNVLNPAIASTFVLYISFLLFFSLFLLTSGIKLKKNGWLFIILVIVVITAPFEIYLMTLDYKMLININYEGVNAAFITELMKKRIKLFGSFPLIELFCYFAFFYLIIFRPMTVDEN